MKKNWTNGLNEQETLDVTSSFKASLVMRKRLIQLLEMKSKSSVNASLSKDAYNSPNWAYLQADNVGYQRALGEVISLITENI